MKTLNGYNLKDLAEVLDQPLPPEAYKRIPAGSLMLTDIDAAWQRRAFNKVFGLYGIGWGLSFEPDNLVVRHESVERKAGSKVEAFAKVIGRFWYAYINENGNKQIADFPVTGSNNSTSGNEAYAMKGAITNAIGFGASMIGWQESVYMGARSHDNTTGYAPGKGGKFVDPEPEPEKKPEVKPKPIKAFICEECERIINMQTKPATCKCGCNKFSEHANMKAAQAYQTEQLNLAQKLGFNSAQSATTPAEDIKYLSCPDCGWAEPVNDMPPACPGCGVADNLVQSKDLESMQKEAAKFSAKQEVQDTAARSKELLEGIKDACGKDRRLILQSLSNATGRTVKGYSECSIPEMEKCLKMLQAKPAAPVQQPFKDKASLCKEVYAVARGLNLGGPRQIIAEIGKVAGKEINTAASLHEDELLAVLENFRGRVSQ